MACAESSWDKHWDGGKRCVGKTKMAQIVASTNERPQSAKKYEQRYLFPPCIRGTWARTARGPFAEIGTVELQPQPCPHCGTSPYKL